MKTDLWAGGVHAAANLFPMMTDEELKDLVDDISTNGLLQPVYVMPDGSLLDGRNRVRACQRIGVVPTTKTYDGGDPIGFVLSLNLKRRHLTTGQKAMLALEVERLLSPGQGARTDLLDIEPPADRREVPRRERESAERAAKSVGTSGRAVTKAKRIQQEAPDLAEKVAAGDLALDRADRIVRDRETAKKQVQHERSLQSEVAKGNKVTLHVGDFRQAMSGLRDVDAIITDPPYPKEYLPLLDDLAAWAKSVLKPNGVMAVMMGQSYLPEVFARLSGHLPYLWTIAYLTPGGQAVQIWDRKVNTFWKPIIIYGATEDWFGDVAKSETNDNDKRHHKWGQSTSGMNDLIKRLVAPGSHVVDPFLGAGTTGVAARLHGCDFTGCDIDETHVETARHRLGLDDE
jgi:16S rRNA G966 N2-methylase RsmD